MLMTRSYWRRVCFWIIRPDSPTVEQRYREIARRLPHQADAAVGPALLSPVHEADS
jgi:hypothetical protein